MLSFYRQLFDGLPREVWALAMVTFVQRSGAMVMPFLTLYLTTQHGFSAREAGGVLSLYGIGSIVGAYLGGWLSDRLGAMRTQALGLSFTSASLLTLGAMRTPGTIMLGVLLMSTVAEVSRPANAAALAQAAPAHLHVRAFGLRRLAMNLGMSIGPAVGGILVSYSYHWLFLVEAGVYCVAASLLWFLLRHAWHTQPQEKTQATDRVAIGRSPYRDGIFLVLVVLVTLLISSLCQLFGAYPLTLTGIYGLPTYVIGLVFTLNTLVIVAFQMPIVHVVERYDALRVVGIGAFLLCGGFALVASASSPLLLAGTVLVWTLGEMLTTPLLEGFVATRSRGVHQGQYMGLFSSAFSMAFVVAPLAGNWIYEVYGYQTLWWSYGALGALLWGAFTVLSGADRKSTMARHDAIGLVGVKESRSQRVEESGQV